MKIRYAHQRRKNDCGAVVIINAAKWSGAKISYIKEYQTLCELLGIENDCGTTFEDVKELIEWSSFPFKISRIRRNITNNLLDRHLNKGGAAIFFDDWLGHVFLVAEFTKKKYVLINFYNHVTISKFTIKEFDKILRHHNRVILISKV